MSTTEELTPLVLPGSFHLPVIYPPKLGAIPQLYYDGLATAHGVTVSVTPSTPTGPFQITVDGTGYTETRTRKRKKQQTTHTIKAEDVYALTAGFASFEQGKVVLRLWASDVDNLVKTAGVRPNRIVYGSLDPQSVASSFGAYIAELPTAVLQESWSQKNAGVPPNNVAVLQAALLTRFLQGDARIYVEAGDVLGTGTKLGPTSMMLTVECFFDPGDPPSPAIPVPVEDVIDNALQPGRLIRYAGHPLVKAAGAVEINVHFKATFQIFNNLTQKYEAFKNGMVTLLVSPAVPLLPDDLIPKLPIWTEQTDSSGRVDFARTLPSRANIRFRYDTTTTPPLKVGKRTFDADIETDPHPARAHVDASFVNAHTYRAKYEIYPHYQAFIDDVAAQGALEPLGKDRGNADEFDKSLPTKLLSLATLTEVLEAVLPDRWEPRIAFSQHELQAQIAGCEAFHKLDPLPDPSDTFTLLVEGDSWTNYPLAFNELYSHLDEIFQRKLKDDKSYNRIPLQHFGDRGDHMFVAGAGGKRQFDFTLDFLDEYQVDLILCSAGGNDFAEPGISADFDVEPFKDYINAAGYFDPYAAAHDLTAVQLAQATALMKRSFAALLRNHPWNFFLRGVPEATFLQQQKSESALQAELDPLILALGGDFGYTPEEIDDIQQMIGQLDFGIDPQSITNPVIQSAYEQAVELTQEGVWDVAFRLILQTIGGKVIENFPVPPMTAGGPAALLLETVFDVGTTTDFLTERYTVIEQRWRNLLIEAKARGIPVISHTYGYPLFSEARASYLGQGKSHITGPWFTHRFAEAHVSDRRVQKMCLKAFLDHIEHHVFQQLKTEYAPFFVYVDSRDLNSDAGAWRDELHLKSPGYQKIAKELYALARIHAPAVVSCFEP
jgi:hypothetical protein